MPTTSDRQKLLLDTHIWLWLVGGSGQLDAASRQTISRALGSGRLWIAAISLWEIALLAARGRILLGKSIGLWFQEALAAPGPAIEALSPSIAVESYALPGQFHHDPADRMIVATARVTGAALMTRDRRILDYAARGHLAAIAA
ncbi:MAG: type II toxin-antitoxin system VapC family toxin [Alphaproteobacteria bacterium]|nr:type II toxin-antitoxin system VapC family toxin [Alphaproteobacteria bacterium]